jgi:hypothetical protein
VGLALARRAPREAGGGRRTVVTRTRESEGGGPGGGPQVGWLLGWPEEIVIFFIYANSFQLELT